MTSYHTLIFMVLPNILYLLARLDDIMLLDSDEFRPYARQSKQILQASIQSSKNIHKKSDWHWQVLIGCLNPSMCVYIALATYKIYVIIIKYMVGISLLLYPNKWIMNTVLMVAYWGLTMVIYPQ